MGKKERGHIRCFQELKKDYSSLDQTINLKEVFKTLLHLGRDLKCTDLRALGPEGISRTWFHHFNGILIIVDR